MGIRTCKEWPCATGDSATYFVAAEMRCMAVVCHMGKVSYVSQRDDIYLTT
jgi:hypothetical protein